MQQLKLILILASCLVLKATMVAGAEVESGTENVQPVQIESAQPKAVPPSQGIANTGTSDQVQNNTVKVNVQGNNETRLANENRVYNENVGSVMAARVEQPYAPSRTAITPMVGVSDYYGNWGSHIDNDYTLGLGLEVALNPFLGIEIEGGYGRYNIAYQSYRHNFNLYQVGGNGKFYFSRSVLQPWIGFGVTGLYYENMSRGPSFPYSSYNQWVGAIQPMAGVDVEIVKGLAIGARGAYVIPTFNKPTTYDNGYTAYPYYEESAAMNTSFYKIMADVKLMF